MIHTKKKNLGRFFHFCFYRNPRLNVFEVCIERDKCSLLCNAGDSTDISRAVSHHWEKVWSPDFNLLFTVRVSLKVLLQFQNPHCHPIGIAIEISSTVYFPKFTIPDDWLNGNYKLRELQVDVENIFEISANAFVGTVFEWMQRLVLINLQLHSMDTIIRKS